MSNNQPEMVTSVPVSHPAELAVITPYLLGYFPRRSVVVLPRIDDQLGTMVRFDVGMPSPMIRSVVAGLVRDGAREAIVLAFEAQRGEANASTAEICRTLEASGITVATTGRVHDDTVEIGAEGPRPLSDYLHAAAPFVALGVNPYPSREAMADALTPCHVPDGLAEALQRDEAVTATECATAWAQILDPAAGPVEALEVETLRAAVIGLSDLTARDALIASVWPMIGSDEHEAIREGVTAMRKVVPDAREHSAAQTHAMIGRLVAFAGTVPSGEHRDAAITVAGHGLFWSGQGTEAGVLLEEAARHGYTLAGLLLRLLSIGVRPR